MPDDLLYGALNASTKDARIGALRAIGEGGFLEAIPVLRASFAQDPAWDVRVAAAHALAKVGDVEVVDRFVRMLAARQDDPAGAKVAAQALGILGDARGIGELVRAFAEGWQSTVVAAALRDVGPVALGPLIDRILDKPELAGRKAAMVAFAELPAPDLEAALAERLRILPPPDEMVAQRTVLLAIAVAQPSVGRSIGGRIRALHPEIFEKTASKEAKTLAKRIDKAQGGASGKEA